MGIPNSLLQLTIIVLILGTSVIISSPVPALPGVNDPPQQEITVSSDEAEISSSSESSTRTGASSTGAGTGFGLNSRTRTGLWYRGQTQQNPVADLYSSSSSRSQGQGQILNSRVFPYNLTGEAGLGVGIGSSHSHHGLLGSSSSSNSAYQASDEHVAAWREVRKRSGSGSSRSGLNGLKTNAIQKRNTNITTTQILLNGTDTSDSNHTIVLRSFNSSTPFNTLNSTLSPSMRARNPNETCTLEPAFLCLMDLIHFQRDKDRRLFAIKEYVMHQLGFTTRNPSRPLPSVDRTFIQQFNPSSPFSGQLQTLYASCDIPSNVDEDTWNSADNFNIYFTLPSSMLAPTEENVNTANGASSLNNVDDDSSSESLRSFHAMIRASSNRNPQRPNINIADISESIAPSLGQLQQQQQRQQQVASPSRNSVLTSNVISAKLKLYKIGRGEQAETPKFEPLKASEPCNQTTAELSLGGGEQTVGAAVVRNLQDRQGPSAEEKIRVSVYWYTVPVKKHHYKKKLLDTKMVSVKESKWIEFDIRNAAIMSAWLERRENYGLVVQVENEDNDWMDARHYFAGLPCAVSKGDQGAENTNSTGTSTNETSASASVVQQEPSVGQTPDVLPPPVLEICTLSIPSAPVVTSTFPVISKQSQNRILIADPKVKSHHHQHQNQSHRNGHHGHRHRHNHGDRETRRHQNQNGRNRQQSQVSIQSTEQDPNQSSPGTINSSSISSQNQSHQESSSVARQNQNGNTNNNNNNSGDDKFSLDEDHPLRDILATVASSHGSSSESRQRKGQSSSGRQGYSSQNQNQAQYQPQSTQSTTTAATAEQRLDIDYYNDEDYDDEDSNVNHPHVSRNANSNSDEGDDEGGHDVIIQKIYISPPSSSSSRHESSSNSRTRSRRHHRPSSKSQSQQLQTDFEQIGII